jgi:hypothetical protein
MDATLSEVVKHCAAQVAAYSACVENHPDNWNEACVKQRHGLSLCAENNVASLKRIRKQCEEEIRVYDACVAEHYAQPERCIEALRALHLCTERAAGRPLHPIVPANVPASHVSSSPSSEKQ